MAIQQWSEKITLADLQDDPQFTEDINAILDLVQTRTDVDVVLNFGEVTFLNSSNIAKLLKLRKHVMITNDRRLKLRNFHPCLGSISRYRFGQNI